MKNIFILTMIIALSGCASFERMKAPPFDKPQISIVVSQKPPSRMNDMPIGVYHIPESASYLAGHQKANAGAAFGLIGLAISNNINSNRGKKMIHKVEGKLTIDAKAMLASLLANKIEARNGRYFSLVTEAKKNAFNVTFTPYIVITKVADKSSVVYVILKASMKNPDGGKIWYSRYIGASDKSRPISGINSWSSDNGALFKKAVENGMNRVINVALRDLKGKYNRKTAKTVKIKTHYAFIKPKLELQGKLLAKNDKYIVFLPKIGDAAVIAGVSIFNNDTVLIKQVVEKKKANTKE